MPVFHYPKVKHKRTHAPPRLGSYRAYKPYLRTEFYGTCVYCRKPDRFGDPDEFGVDHYRPKSHFPSLKTEYSNLFYACNPCNRRKGDYWPQAQQPFIPNPCEHAMFDHLRSSSDGQVIAHSEAGRWTIDLLLLNESTRVEFRKAILGAIELAAERERRLRETIYRLRRAVSGSPKGPDGKLTEALKEHEQRLNEVLEYKRILSGS